eukprot:g4425.t1
MINALNPDSIYEPFGNYAQGVCLDSTQKLVSTSGQLGISKDGAIPAELDAQARLCFANIEAILQSAGMNPDHVFHLRTFVTDRAYFAPYMAIRDEFLNNRAVASTLLIVSGFTLPEFKIEIEALAAI